MTAANDPLARVQAMVAAWTEGELLELFDTTASEVSPPNAVEKLRLWTISTLSTPGI